MENGVLINMCEDKVPGKMCMLHQQAGHDLWSQQKFESFNLELLIWIFGRFDKFLEKDKERNRQGLYP